MEVEFRLNNRRRKATRERVIEAMQDVAPEPKTPYMVDIEGIAYPMRQAFSETFGVGRNDAGTKAMMRVFEGLGFEVTTGGRMATRPRPKPPSGPWRPTHRLMSVAELEVQELDIPTIVLHWSYLEPWEALAESRPGVDCPPHETGVYEVVGKGHDGSLYIGRATDLVSRVCYGLMSGAERHPAGQKIRENEDPAELRVRWAVTDRPAAGEEGLHRRHIALHGSLPKYTMRT